MLAHAAPPPKATCLLQKGAPTSSVAAVETDDASDVLAPHGAELIQADKATQPLEGMPGTDGAPELQAPPAVEKGTFKGFAVPDVKGVDEAGDAQVPPPEVRAAEVVAPKQEKEEQAPAEAPSTKKPSAEKTAEEKAEDKAAEDLDKEMAKLQDGLDELEGFHVSQDLLKEETAAKKKAADQLAAKKAADDKLAGKKEAVDDVAAGKMIREKAAAQKEAEEDLVIKKATAEKKAAEKAAKEEEAAKSESGAPAAASCLAAVGAALFAFSVVA